MYVNFPSHKRAFTLQEVSYMFSDEFNSIATGNALLCGYLFEAVMNIVNNVTRNSSLISTRVPKYR